MSKCPYTWFKGIFGGGTQKSSAEAEHLRVQVSRDHRTVVDVALPARSARWLMDVIPGDVIGKIKEEGIPIEEIQDYLSQAAVLNPCPIFTLEEPTRVVKVWLE